MQILIQGPGEMPGPHLHPGADEMTPEPGDRPRYSPIYKHTPPGSQDLIRTGHRTRSASLGIRGAQELGHGSGFVWYGT